MLPLWSEWDQLELRKAHATVADVTAETTPQLKALEQYDDVPKGWHAFVIRGKQTAVLDAETIVVGRQATMSVICAPLCKFWSATAQVRE